MDKQNKIKKFLETKPSVSQMSEFIEVEAQTRAKEIKEQEKRRVDAQYKERMQDWCKDAENVEWLNRWAKDKDPNHNVISRMAHNALRAVTS